MDKFTYYGDDWLLLREQYNKMTPLESMMFQAQTGIELITPNELAFINGAKMNLIRAIAKMTAINRLLDLDHQKYMPIFLKRGLVVDYSKMIESQHKPKVDTMFQ